ncbi:hypothetical protein CRE_19227 [Caenorhabditis remanei]|nr:hypothetical protein CRE_19227 [Caenorhabditis remanei]
MKFSSLLLLVFLVSTFAHCESLLCYSGFEGAMEIESGFDYCYDTIDFDSREVVYDGHKGHNHIFNETRPIEMEDGPCFINYEKQTVATYCYCTDSLCNVPRRTRRLVQSTYLLSLLEEYHAKHRG